MSYNPKNLFNQIQKKEQEVSEGGPQQTNQFANPNIIKPTKNGTLTLRLLWLPPAAGTQRDYPMINSYIHECYDPHATSKKYGKVVCTTSQYINGETVAGFNSCPICKLVSKYYKESQEGSKSAEDLYKTFRRTCRGYVPVYVVNGPEDMIGQVKILQYGKQFKDFFNRKIFGIAGRAINGEEPEPISEDEIIGIDAFMYHNTDAKKIETIGYDLIVTTTTKVMSIDGKQVNMPQYSLDFSRRPRNIDTINGVNLDSQEGIELFKNLNETISFDKDFYILDDDKTRQDFVTNFIMRSEVESESKEEAEETETVAKKPAAKKAVTPPAPKVEEQLEEGDAETASDVDAIDVDSLLANLK